MKKTRQMTITIQPEDLDGYDDMNLIMNNGKKLCLINSMNYPKFSPRRNYNYKITKRLGLSFYISFMCSCENVIHLCSGTRVENPSNCQMTDLNMLSIFAGSFDGLQRTCKGEKAELLIAIDCFQFSHD